MLYQFRAWDGNVWMYSRDIYENDLSEFFGQVDNRTRELKDYGRDEMKIMQYTGLKDKNGKEIYEGDVVITTGNFGAPFNAAVYWNQKMASFCLTDKDGLPVGAWHWNNQLEIIGNIYENPELRT